MTPRVEPRRRGLAMATRSAALCLVFCLALPAQAVVLTGEVRAVDAQPLYVPQSNSAPVVLRYFVAEGTTVRKGDTVLRIDPGQSGSAITELDAQIEQARAKSEKERAELQVKAIDADIAVADADAKLGAAKIDASIPRGLASALDYDRYQGELERATRESALKRNELEAARKAVQRRGDDARLEIEKLVVKRDYMAALVQQSKVRAQRDGVVVHGFNNGWLGGRIDEGSSAMPGSKAGEVVSGTRMQVRAWALQCDRPGLHDGQPVRLDFDAWPGRPVAGRISQVSGASEVRAEWGNGRYVAVEITFDARRAPRLLPGMSVRVTFPLSDDAKGSATR